MSMSKPGKASDSVLGDERGDELGPGPTGTPGPASAPEGMVPARERRRTKVERGLMRLVATGGIIGIAVALGAILGSQNVAGWITGLVIGLTSVILAALLWSSRQL
ncbi:MAG: hypothetical protein QOH62_1580 [Solirubrobacteraceae bacterium]|nr:hypothetical protein [Solirubrobacteraceae bacterium]